MNIYLSKIQEISFDNKYTKWYVNIIENALLRGSIEEYTEKHHILPKSFKMGGEKDKLNLVSLTAREHFIVHMLLVKMTIDELSTIKIACALIRMMDNKYNNSRTYETARKIFSKNNPMLSDEIKERLKQSNLEKYGVEYPIQNGGIKQKIKETNILKYGVENVSQLVEVREKVKQTVIENFGVENPMHSSEVREKVKQTNLEIYGCEWQTQSKNFKEKSKQTNLEKYGAENYQQSEEGRMKNKNHWETMPIVICPYCGKSGKEQAMKHWHFDNCKKRKL